MRKKVMLAYCLFLILLVVTQLPEEVIIKSVSPYFELGTSYLGIDNPVTGIYLYYRLFDTLFEALLLLTSVVGIIYFSRYAGEVNEEKK
jgi:multisubunit Na+/H+ antiporter MnhB subunit